MNRPSADAIKDDWDALHERPRFRPRYPSESVVRFVAAGFGRASSASEARRILDLGCGAGRHLRLIEEFGHDAVGLDYSVAGLTHAREIVGARTAKRLACFTFDAIPVSVSSFDGIIAWGVLCYTDAMGFRDAIESVRTTLRPGGRALIVTRSTDDHRFAKGSLIDRHTYRIEITETNEEGMPMHFLDRADIDEVFADFSAVTVDRNDHTAGGGAIRNSDWLIECVR